MKAWIFLLVALIITLPFAAVRGEEAATLSPQLGEAWSMTVIPGQVPSGQSLKVRQKPDKDSGVIATLPGGTAVRILDRTDNWLEIEWPGGTAFVPADGILIDPQRISEASASGKVTSGTRVLFIGDSHSVGIFGSELDRLLRDAGAVVRSVASSGSSPSWWWNGTVTKSGYVDRRADGTIDQPADWRTPRKTPLFTQLLQEHRPTLAIIALGANMLGATAARIQADCGRLVDDARAAGAAVVWVGPPDARAASTQAKRADFYRTITSSLAGKATVFDARSCTKYPASGGDGVHYWGREGGAAAKNWARAVFDTLR